MKAMFQVIKYEGDNSNLVYRYPEEDFNTKSRLIVQQAQEAIFYYKGQMADHFDVPDTYILNTQNIPILRHLVNLPFGKESPFHAVVYFVNKTEQTNNKWGVGDIPFVDKAYSVPLKTGVSGEYNFRVFNAETFINKLVGTYSEFSGTKLNEILDSFLKSRVINHLSKYYQINDVDIFLIESRIEDIARYLEEKIREDFLDYGIEITKFVITNIAKHEDSAEYKRYYEYRTQQQAIIDIQNQNERAAEEARGRMNVSIIEQTTQQDLDARGKRVDAEATKYKRDIEGYTYQQERGFDVAEKTAENEGAGNFAAAGMGVGVGLGTIGAAAQAVGGLYNDALSNIGSGNASINPQPENTSENNIFSGLNLGLGDEEQKTTQNISQIQISAEDRLAKIKELYEKGLLTEEKYNQKMDEILREL